ncbi:NAD(P)-dependent oxidoreductase [Terrarubrum flagellatum]|uniref:NAD-dependent epimerase/dehydratase family protein n=1 Tax=Terrirubrum flagellatum TaxID=2895980 RepID=UPI0031453E6A
MRIFLAGATGAVGRRLVPALIRAGHTVVATTRASDKIEMLQTMGAEPVVLDALDRDTTASAVAAARPDAIIHQATALPQSPDLRKFAEAFAQTNRLRTDGLDNLLAAARAAGVRRIVAQSFTGWPNIREGGPVKTEEDPLDPAPAPQFRTTLAAIRYLEDKLTTTPGIDGFALRCGAFYGPGSGFATDGAIWRAVRARRFPVVGSGDGVWSFIHLDDVAAATIAALERGAPGIYNIVDDEPAPVRAWLPDYALAIGAKSPMRIPAFLARLFIGAAGVAMMTDIRGSSNAKAKRDLGWTPRFASWREGFRAGL